MELDLQAPVHAVPEELGLHAGLGRQSDPFANSQADATTNQIVRQLDDGSCPQLSRIYNCVAERIEERPNLLVGFGSSGCQHLQASVRNAIFANDERRIHDSRIAQAKLALDAPYEVRAAARKINI